MTLTAFNFQMLGVETSFGFRFDTLSVTLALMIIVLGAAIAKYSIRYLSGEKRQKYFYLNLSAILISACLLVLSSNLLMLLVFWFLTSAGLHRLLTFYPERPWAMNAARKKFVVSRIGDVALLLGIALTYRSFGTLEFSELFLRIESMSVDHLAASDLSLISILYVIGAISKSALVPFHFWLPETMETPTPVSALMHAGIINAGGFLMIRLSPILNYSDIALFILAVIGAVTAVFGALVMMTQNDIKKKLAYSTISQMGMMMLSCGLGAYSLALFHIVAHSFYKAHAFLSTGELVEESKKMSFGPSRSSGLSLTILSSLGLGVILLGSSLFSGAYLSYFTYGTILLLGLSQCLTLSISAVARQNFRFLLGLSLIFVTTAGVAVLIESFLMIQLSSELNQGWNNSGFHIATCLMVYAIFVLGLWMSAALVGQKSNFSKKLYILVWNGGYFYQTTNRLLGFVSGGRA